MLLSRTIHYKAMLLLAVFAANFFIVCHCSARAVHPAGHSSCCAPKEKKPPCKDGNECGGMHAVKFNLLEKQAAREMISGPQMPIVVLCTLDRPVLTVTTTRTYTDTYTYKHPPPDYQSLYQCFLI